jgi:hypothetical protein
MCSRVTAEFWGPKEPFFRIGMDQRTSNSHIHKMYETLRKTSFCIKGYVEIHIQRLFFDIEKGIWKILVLKIQTVCTCFGVPSTHGSFFLKSTKISIFGGISKFLELNQNHIMGNPHTFC